ncbi:MAG: methyltransferase domain-containing protein [Rhodothermales bacterium]|nr:methyltransferase domain-containing protein [Rhodothermales bacterium]MBO6781602.1 methyltransferase domain-containing protein [Rhodothermales bacterium]
MTRRTGLGVVGVLACGLLFRWGADSLDTWPLMVAAGIGLAACAYWIRDAAPRVWIVVVMAVLLRLLLFSLPPSLSDDSYRYAWDGQLVAEGINPYQYVPSDEALRSFRAHPGYDSLNSAGFYSVYPPASQAVFVAAHWLSGGAFPASFYVLKALVLVAELAALLLLARIVSPWLLLVFATHPMALLSGAGQAHTDALLALPVVAAVWAARRDRWSWVGAAVAVAAHVKLWPVLAAPAFLRKPRAVATGFLVGAGLAAPFVAPYVWAHVSESLNLYVRYFEFNAGPYYAAKEVFRLFTGDDWSKQLGPAFRWLFLGGAGVLLWTAWRARWTLESVLYGLVFLLTVTATTVHPWYLYGVLLLAVLTGRHVAAWSWLSAWSIGTYLLYTGGPYWVFVVVAWTGFALLLLPSCAQWALKRRAVWKASWVSAFAGGNSWLDVGGGEGYVAAELRQRHGKEVTVLETEDRTDGLADMLLYDGEVMPLPARSIDAACAVFVLHHVDNPGGLLREMARVSRGPVIVVESVLRGDVDRHVLPVLDRLANFWRAPSRAAWKEHSSFRSAADWRALFADAGFQVTAESIRYSPLHAKHLWRLTSRDAV